VGAWVAGEAQAANSIVATSIKLIIYQIFLFIFLLQEMFKLVISVPYHSGRHGLAEIMD
jgi:hypothetical protein